MDISLGKLDIAQVRRVWAYTTLALAYTTLGVAEGSVSGGKDLEKVRQKTKELYKRFMSEKKEPEAKKVLEAFDLVKKSLSKKRDDKDIYAKKSGASGRGEGKAPNGQATRSVTSSGTQKIEQGE
eukprot:CAMPEP_0180542162 /NCGR_PEP_ID=MMETSP1036_2-20121128/68320_1 /TAXON_ID=632150 /ORGANISM="Azadinium spinosum, Strain 3D9" /LENGTH=124 /DNA_ID=CAMNT_0022557041 /DNA_START=124 /DNA_END=496 /DNA_ORIENTATION=-